MNNLKKFALLVLIIQLSYGLSAQTDVPIYKPEKGDYGIGLSVSGLLDNINVNTQSDFLGNNVFNFRYFWKEQTAFRLGIGLEGLRTNVKRVDSIGKAQVEIDSTASSLNFYFNPEIEKHFKTNSKLDPYLGVGIHLGILGKSKSRSTRTTTDTTGTATRDFDSNYAGGFRYGVYTNWGFNYFIAPKLALGAEYRFGVFNSRLGGDYNTVIVDTPISGQPKVTRTIGSLQTSSLGFDLNTAASITLSYFF